MERIAIEQVRKERFPWGYFLLIMLSFWGTCALGGMVVLGLLVGTGAVALASVWDFLVIIVPVLLVLMATGSVARWLLMLARPYRDLIDYSSEADETLTRPWPNDPPDNENLTQVRRLLAGRHRDQA